MKRLVLFCLFLAASLLSQAQSTVYAMHPLYVPKSATTSVGELAAYIQSQTNSEEDKTLLAYQWVINNIEYSTDSVLSINWHSDFNEKAEATLRRRKGVCDNFSSLFVALLQKMNIPATVVYGMSNLSTRTGHGWTAFYSNGSWWLSDPTWDAGSHHQLFYFKQTPEVFIHQHWPFDPLWQLAPTPINYAVFSGTEKKRNKAVIFPNVTDSALAYLQSDSLQQYRAANRRIEQMGMNTDLLHTWHAANRMNIAMIDEERNEQMYNKAVEEVNEVSNLLNLFIQYRNKQFQPSKNEKNTRAMLQDVPTSLHKAKGFINLIGIGTPNYQYNTSALEAKVEKLQLQFVQQRSFLEQYFKRPLEKRDALFYR